MIVGFESDGAVMVDSTNACFYVVGLKESLRTMMTNGGVPVPAMVLHNNKQLLSLLISFELLLVCLPCNPGDGVVADVRRQEDCVRWVCYLRRR